MIKIKKKLKLLASTKVDADDRSLASTLVEANALVENIFKKKKRKKLIKLNDQHVH
jgi:hypothetical protein